MNGDKSDRIKQFAFLYQDANGTNQIEAFGGEVSANEIERTKEFCRAAAFLQTFVANFASLQTDFEALADIERGLVAARQAAPSIIHSAMVDTLLAQAEAQRLLSNFISSAAAFRDRALTKISKKYGNPSDELKDIKRFISTEYDANLSYRIMYNLRNYSAHEDAPISIMPVNLSRGEDDKFKIHVNVMLKKSDLIASTDVNKNVREELREIGIDTFDINVLALDYFKSHRNMLSFILKCHLPSLRSEYNYFEKVFSRGGHFQGSAPVLMDAEKTENGLNMNILHLPLEMIEFFEFIEKD